jgi:hypothetical protein
MKTHEDFVALAGRDQERVAEAKRELASANRNMLLGIALYPCAAFVILAMLFELFGGPLNPRLVIIVALLALYFIFDRVRILRSATIYLSEQKELLAQSLRDVASTSRDRDVEIMDGALNPQL